MKEYIYIIFLGPYILSLYLKKGKKNIPGRLGAERTDRNFPLLPVNDAQFKSLLFGLFSIFDFLLTHSLPLSLPSWRGDLTEQMVQCQGILRFCDRSPFTTVYL